MDGVLCGLRKHIIASFLLTLLKHLGSKEVNGKYWQRINLCGSWNRCSCRCWHWYVLPKNTQVNKKHQWDVNNAENWWRRACNLLKQMVKLQMLLRDMNWFISVSGSLSKSSASSNYHLSWWTITQFLNTKPSSLMNYQTDDIGSWF